MTEVGIGGNSPQDRQQRSAGRTFADVQMREITLQEYVRSEPMRLSAAELSTLQTSKLSINIAPTGDADGEYRLTPGSTVGAVELGDLSVFIRAEDRHPATSLNGVLRH